MTKIRVWGNISLRPIIVRVCPQPQYRFLDPIYFVTFSWNHSSEYFPIIFVFSVFTTISWPLNNNLFTIIYKIIIWLNYPFLIFPFSNQSPPGWRMVPTQPSPESEKRKLGEKNVKINRLIRIVLSNMIKINWNSLFELDSTLPC